MKHQGDKNTMSTHPVSTLLRYIDPTPTHIHVHTLPHLQRVKSYKTKVMLWHRKIKTKQKKSNINPRRAGVGRQGNEGCNTDLPQQTNPQNKTISKNDALEREDDAITRSGDLDGVEVLPMSTGSEVH